MKTQRPVEDYLVYKEQKKERLNSWTAVPLSDQSKTPKECQKDTKKASS